MEWPGMFGWLGTIAALAGLWFGVSALVLGSAAERMESEGPEAREAAVGAFRLGFGSRFIRAAVPASRGLEASEAVPDPLTGYQLKRARLAVLANARASGVFCLFTFALAAFLWGFRLLDPATLAARKRRLAAEAARGEPRGSGAES
jgi:hypothetical protein